MSDTQTRIADDYDTVAYPTPLLPIQGPDRLAAATLLQGFVPPPPQTASVLEIGCAVGYNLLAAAAADPGGRYVGFDLSEKAIAAGRQLAADAGLANVVLERGDILTWPRDGARFDYITCHGLYTWVPEHVRGPLLELIGALLAPGGVAYVSYDCMPGTAGKDEIVEFLRRATSGISDPRERIRTAIAIGNTLKRHQREGSRIKPLLETLTMAAEKHPGEYFFHDWLAEFYSSTSLEDFVGVARSHGLELIGDAGLRDLHEADLDENARELLAAAEGDRVTRNVVFDLLRGDHSFRTDLLVRSDAPPPARKDPMPHLSFSFDGARREIDGDGRKAILYSNGRSGQLTLTDPTEQSVLDAIDTAYPRRLSYQEIMAASGAEESKVRRVLAWGCTLGIVDFHAAPAACTFDPGERPRASGLARAVAQGNDWTISLRHSRIPINDPVTRRFLILCDGSRTLPEIAAVLSADVGVAIPLEKVAEALETFSRASLFEA
jgi:SAM-dependent methyltransferase